MNDVTNYKSLINTIFWPGTASPKSAPGTSNPVIGGLNYTGASFRQFSAAFTKRLQRISRLYPPGSAEWDFLLEQANLISSPSNWEGAYSELAAYDFFHHAFRHKSSSPWQMKFNQDISNTETFAAALGGTGNANLDLHFPWSDVYADIKSLKDIVEELLESVAIRAAQRKGIKNLVAIPAYPAGIDYTEIQNRFQDLVKEVEQVLDITKKPNGCELAFVRFSALINPSRNCCRASTSILSIASTTNPEKEQGRAWLANLRNRPSSRSLTIAPAVIQ